MTHLSFKQFSALIDEQVELYIVEAQQEGLDEGAIRDMAVSIGQAIATAAAEFKKQFKRQPTPSEAAAIRKKLRDARAAAERARTERMQRTMSDKPRSAAHPQSAAGGRHAEREWIDQLGGGN